MIIQKFGGTSMGSAQSICGNVAPIIENAVRAGQAPVVVVSAMSGVTNQLLDAARQAVEHHAVAEAPLREIRNRHMGVLAGLAGNTSVSERAGSAITDEVDELANLLKALTVVGDLSPRTYDAVLAVGEKLSAQLMTCVLNVRGIEAEYVNLEHVIPQELVYESDAYWDAVEEFFRARIEQVRAGVTPVLTGFFGPCAGGMLGAVGRGYSDYCASLAGAALKASEIQIWTDVDGVLSANPKVVPEAFILRRLSFNETAELAHFGAKVLHPFSVRPAVNAGIALRVLNTFNPQCAGTRIEDSADSLELPLKSITCKKGVTIIRIATPLMLFAYGYLSKIADVFARHRLSVDLIATSEVSVSLSLEAPLTEDGAVLKELRALGDVFLEQRQAIVSLVGVELGRDNEVVAGVFGALAREKIDVRMVSMSNARINLSLVIDEGECDRAVRVLHRTIFRNA